MSKYDDCDNIVYALKMNKATWSTPMPVSEIASFACIKESHPTCPRTRKLIKDAMKFFNVPIGSNNHGFFIIKTGQEMQRYCNSLLKRQVGITETIEITYEAWKANRLASRKR